jgi:hypothetical protein
MGPRQNTSNEGNYKSTNNVKFSYQHQSYHIPLHLNFCHSKENNPYLILQGMRSAFVNRSCSICLKNEFERLHRTIEIIDIMFPDYVINVFFFRFIRYVSYMK